MCFLLSAVTNPLPKFGENFLSLGNEFEISQVISRGLGTRQSMAGNSPYLLINKIILVYHLDLIY